MQRVRRPVARGWRPSAGVAAAGALPAILPVLRRVVLVLRLVLLQEVGVGLVLPVPAAVPQRPTVHVVVRLWRGRLLRIRVGREVVRGDELGGRLPHPLEH